MSKECKGIAVVSPDGNETVIRALVPPHPFLPQLSQTSFRTY
jgi:hypothetical protein